MGEFSWEIISRPFIVSPSRPQEKKVVTAPVAAEDTDRSVATITGSGSIVNLAHTYSASVSRQTQQEVTSTYDVMRVKNPDDPEQHVDVERTTAMSLRDAQNIIHQLQLEKPVPADNIEIIEQDKVRVATGNYGKVVNP